MTKNNTAKLKKQLESLRNKPDKGKSGLKKVAILTELSKLAMCEDTEKACDYAEQALTLAKKIHDMYGIVESLLKLGDVYIARGSKDNTENAKVQSLEALRIAREINDNTLVARCCNQVGIACAKLGQYQQALDLYNECLRIRTANNDKRGVARVSYNLGTVYHYLNDHVNDNKSYQRALRFAEEIGDKGEAAKALCGIGTSHERQGNYNEALKYLLQALEKAREINNVEIAAMSCGAIGNVYFCLGDKERALKHHLMALVEFQKLNIPFNIGFAHNNIACIYNELGDHEKSIEYSLNALDIFGRIGELRGLAAAHGNIASNYRKQGHYEKSLDHYKKALEIARQSGQKLMVVLSYEGMGKLGICTKNYEMAKECLSKGLHMAQEIGTKLHAKDIYQTFCEMYEAKGDAAKALAYYKEYGTLKDDIFNTEKSRQIADMRTRYETEQKEKEAEIYRLRNVELRREIDKRKKAENELKQHRDQLETIVAKRTAKLKAINVELKQEIAERRRVEKELLGYQRQLRSLAHELSLVEEKQRRKIATNLHDNISQSLMIIKSTLDRLVTARSVKQVRHKLEEIQSYIMDIIQRTRSMTFEISPPVLYELGLEPAVEWLAERFQEQHGITCEFQDDGKKKPISEDWRCILFQSTRELLVNARKHANARKVVISTCKDGRHVKVIVKDDGIGFDPSILDEKIAKNEGFGLFNLRQRLTHLRGKVEIASEEGQGTKITISAPLTTNRRTTNRIQT